MKFKPGYLVKKLTGVLGVERYATPADGSAPRLIRRAPHTRNPELPPENLCPCQSFFLCDLLYQVMTPEERLVWRAAVLRPHTSPYDLFMHECLYCSNRGLNLPSVPSPHGGYSMDDAHCSGPTAAPVACLTTPPRYACSGAPLYTCDEDPDGAYATIEDCLAACVPPTPGEPCENCEPDTPATIPVKLEGFAGLYAGLNGDYLLQQNPAWPCLWTIVTDWGWTGLDVSGIILAGWYVQTTGGPPGNSGLEGWAAFAPDCRTGNAAGLACSDGDCQGHDPADWQNAVATW